MCLNTREHLNLLCSEKTSVHDDPSTPEVIYNTHGYYYLTVVLAVQCAPCT